MPQSLFLQMPLHLISLVLSELDCIQSLGSAILSHSSVYAAFNEERTSVMYRILSNQIPPELTAYAAIAHDTYKDHHRGPRGTRKLIRHALKCTHSWLVGGLNWRLRRVLERHRSGPALASALSRTHMLVEHFTHRFLSDTLPIAARDLFGRQGPANAKRPSEKEVYRIRRAFYRFQIYCNVIHVEGDDTRQSDQAQSFFLRWSPWVNEQLACIHDYLEGVLSKAFDEVAAHDIAWGAKSADWLARGRDSEYKQAYLSYGLPFLYDLDRASSHDERLRLLGSRGLPSTASRGLAAGLAQDASPPDESYPHWTYELGRWYEGECEALRKPNSDGPDGLGSAPFLTWLHAHKSSLVTDSVFAPGHWRLRQCGYVLWDAPASKEERRAFRRLAGGLRGQGGDGAVLGSGS